MFLAILFWFNLLVGNQDLNNLRNYYDLLPLKANIERHSDKATGVYYDGIEYIDNLGLPKYTIVYKE